MKGTFAAAARLKRARSGVMMEVEGSTQPEKRAAGLQPRICIALASVLLGAVVAGLAVFSVVAAVVLVFAGVALGLVYLVVRRPFWGILAVIWLIPLHSLGLAVLVSFGTLPESLLTAFKLWKLFLLVLLLLRLWRPTRHRMRITWLDAAIGLFFVVEAAYFAVPGCGLGLDARLFAIQTESLFLLFYVLGRVFPCSYRQFRLIVVSVLAVGWIAAILAVLEWLVVPGWLYRLDAYFSYLGKDISQHLPIQFYTSIGGTLVQRPGSFYLNPIEFSFAMLLPIGITLGLALHNAYRPVRRLWLGLLLMLGALLLALNRSSILGLASAVAFVVLIRPRMPRWFFVAGCVLLVLGLVLGAVLGLDQLLVDTINVSEPSAQGHLARWKLSLQAMRTAPLGLGLGCTGFSALRLFGREVVLVTENWYFQVATEMGIPTGLLFLSIIVLLVMQGVRIQRRMPDRFLRGSVMGFVATTVALGITSLFLHTWAYDAVAFPFWLLAGLVTQLPEWTSPVRGSVGAQQSRERHAVGCQVAH